MKRLLLVDVEDNMLCIKRGHGEMKEILNAVKGVG